MSGLDVLLARPLALRAHADVLTSQRLDLDYYLPERVAAEARVKDGQFPAATLNSLRRNDRPITDGIRRHDKSDSGVHLIRTQNLVGPSVDYAGTAFINEEWHRTGLKSEVLPGDLLVAIRGYLGAAAIVIEGSPRANINQHIARIAVDETRCSTRYLWAFLSCRVGRTVLERYVTGTVQRGVTLPDLRALRVPVPDRRIQEFVAAKVELAERCRARSDTLLNEAVGRFETLLRSTGFRPGHALTNVIDARHVTDRLTGEFYLPRYFALEAHLATLGVPVKPLRSLLRCDVIRSSTPARSEGAPVPCILTSDIDPHEIRWRSPSMHIAQSVHDGHAGRLASRDIVYTSVGPPVGEAALVLPQFLPMAAGGDVSILRHGDDVHPGFLALYLNSVFGQMQNDRYSRGIRQRRVYPEDIGAFLVPVFSREDQAYIGERIARHQALNERAVEFVNESKANVEALLDGTLDVDGILAGRIERPSASTIPELSEATA